MKVLALDHVRWELMWLPTEMRHEVARGLDRLEIDPIPRGAERVGGTRRLYRWRRGECRILYVHAGDRIVVVSLSDAQRGLPERFRRRDPELDDEV